MKLQDQQWPLIWHLQESEEERTGLTTLTLTAATMDHAKQLADERLGNFLRLAHPWKKEQGLCSPQYQGYVRYVDTPGSSDPTGLSGPDIPRGTWQHISPEPLYGAGAVTEAPAKRP